MATPSAPAATARHLGSGRVSALLEQPMETSGPTTLQLLNAKGAPLGQPVSAMVRSEGGFARMRARIDPHLPPGRYAARLSDDAQSRPIEIVVEPSVALRIDPPTLKISGGSGAEVETQVMIANVGNIPAELPSFAAFGIFPKGGVEDAIARAYRSDAEDGLQTLSRFVEGLRSNYGGLVRVKIPGCDAIAPGTARRLALHLELPRDLQPGRRYSGIWPLLNLNVSVQLEISNDPPRRRKGTAK